MMDNELLELCKEVYEKTGWGATNFAFFNYENTDDEPKWEIYPIVNDVGSQRYFAKHKIPLYTSDYLLEKLPKTLPPFEKNDWALYMEVDPWFFTYIDQQDNAENSNYSNLHPKFKRSELKADTPVKALLKLVIALHKAGQLTMEGNGE